jgi:hypothetical protein
VTLNPGVLAATLAALAIALIITAAIHAGHQNRKEGK